MVYVIKRDSDGKYVARPGSAHSYTNDRQQAAEYSTEAEARRNACGNESIWFTPDASWQRKL